MHKCNSILQTQMAYKNCASVIGVIAPDWDGLRNDARFDDRLKKMCLPREL